MTKKSRICLTTCAVIFFALSLFSLIGLNSIIKSFIQQNVILSPETYDMWGANPGATNTLTLRNFTFYNLSNPRQYLYHGQKPKFTEISNFLYQELSNFTNHRYSQDMSELYYNYWLHFGLLPYSRNVNESIHVLNLAPLGFWNQIDSVGISTFALQGFGGLFVEMNNTIKKQAIAQGAASQFLKNYGDLKHICIQNLIMENHCNWIWKDQLFGLSNANHWQVWIDLSIQSDFVSERLIADYFNLNMLQMEAIKTSLREWSDSLNEILSNWYCEGILCLNYDLTISQLSQSGLTNNPPPGGDPAESICSSGNKTCAGYPEIPIFLKYEFSKKNDSRYKNLTFSTQTVSNLFSPYNGTFLNIGNLTKLFQVGEEYDKTKKSQLIEQIQKMTHSQSTMHAQVLWQYAKYFTNQFILKSKEKGTRKIAALAGIFSQAIYQSFNQFADWILKQQLSLLVASEMKNCTQFILNYTPDLSYKANKICQNTSETNYSSYYNLIQACGNYHQKQSFRKQNNLKGVQIDQLCDNKKMSVSKLIQIAHQKIHNKYNCTINPIAKRCTKFELAVKQFINSTISLNPIQNIFKQYKPSLTAKSWNSELQEFQYRHFLKQYYGDDKIDTQIFKNQTQLYELLSFDKLFSVPMLQNLLLQQDSVQFQKLFYWKNMTLLKNYIKFITIEVGFGGFTMKRTVNEILFGYEDQFLKALKQMDPMLGGDPSIETLVALNQPNATIQDAEAYHQSMYSGYSDPFLTRNYITNFDLPYITMNKTSYDGYKISSELVSPYSQPVKITGTDAFQNKPSLVPTDNLFIFIDNLYRIGELTYYNQTEKYGFQLLEYHISNNTLASEDDYPPNKNFNQKYDGFMNLSFTGVPVYASKNHFHGVKGNWSDLIETYDEAGNKQEASQYDQTYLLVEPNTGASFTATIYLQTNYLTRPDILFDQSLKMLPIFSLYRSGNISESSANDLFGDLKIALGAQRKVFLFGIVGALICLLIICCILQIQTETEKTKKPSLLESQGEIQDLEQPM